MDEPRITVADNAERSRYDVFVDGEPAGFAAYHLVGERVVITHTEIDPAFGGQGVGSVLARATLDDVRRQGKRVTPLCPFTAAFIRKHPEYVDLVDDAHRADFADPPS